MVTESCSVIWVGVFAVAGCEISSASGGRVRWICCDGVEGSFSLDLGIGVVVEVVYGIASEIAKMCCLSFCGCLSSMADYEFESVTYRACSRLLEWAIFVVVEACLRLFEKVCIHPFRVVREVTCLCTVEAVISKSFALVCRNLVEVHHLCGHLFLGSLLCLISRAVGCRQRCVLAEIPAHGGVQALCGPSLGFPRSKLDPA